MRRAAPRAGRGWFWAGLLLVLLGCSDPSSTVPTESPACDGSSQCRGDGDCAAGQRCESCFCERIACDATSDCPDGTWCRFGACRLPACETSDDCPGGEICDGERTCRQPTCLLDGCPDRLFCRYSDGACVECKSDLYCFQDRPICDVDVGTCIGCRWDVDCEDRGAGRFCTDGGSCVACREDADCAGEAPHCVEGACVACRSNTDCGGAACRPDGTCDPGAEDGEACEAGGVCAPGFVCAAGDVCRPACSLYAPSCGADRICVPLRTPSGIAIEDGVPVGACVSDDEGTAAGYPCGAGEPACSADLECFEAKAGAPTCRRYCDPHGDRPGCGGAEVCVETPYGAGGSTVGVCSPPTRYLSGCTIDADCATNQGCAPMPDGSGGIRSRCTWSRGEGGPGTPCVSSTDCRSAHCVPLTDGGGFCYGACGDGCDTGTLCAPVRLEVGQSTTVDGDACRPACKDTGECAAWADTVCGPLQLGQSLAAACTAAVGSDRGGTPCSDGASCASGWCEEEGLPDHPTGQGRCVESCSLNTTCPAETACRPVAIRTSTPGAPPEFGVLESCWGIACRNDADCAEGLSCNPEIDPVDPDHRLRLGCSPPRGITAGGHPCDADGDCRSGLCLVHEPATTPDCAAAGCPESCGDGSDDDGDGLVGCEDPDCAYTAHCGRSYCLGGCSSDRDCPSGTGCRQRYVQGFLGSPLMLCRPLP